MSPIADARFRRVDAKRWAVEADFTVVGNTQTWVVPAGFVTDFASIPRFLTWLIQTYGLHLEAALVHDYLWSLCRKGEFNYPDADGIFRMLLRVLGVKPLQRWMMWTAVRCASLHRSIRITKPVDLLRISVMAPLGVCFVALPSVVVIVFALVARLLNNLSGIKHA